MPNQPDRHPADFAALRRVSADIGADPMLIQAGGGNTSLKDGAVMWIKASGTLLEEAETKDIFVPVDLPAIRKALLSGERRADTPARFLLAGGAGLRPSIETCLHAIFPHRVVLHAHCINTLAHVLPVGRARLLTKRLKGTHWALVPYARPGANLARLVSEKLDGRTDVVVLGNHGLIVAGETVGQARALLFDVHSRLAVAPIAKAVPDLKRLAAIARHSRYVLPEYLPLHQLALDPDRTRQAVSGSLYPDHVVYCGVGATALEMGETPDQASSRITTAGGPAPVFLIVPGQGVLVRRDASSGALALMRCLADVLVRVPADADLLYLTRSQNLELLNWDAETYRRTLDAG